MLYYPEKNWVPKVAKKGEVVPGLTDFLMRYSPLYVDGRRKNYVWLDDVLRREVSIEDKILACIQAAGKCHPEDVQEMFYQDHRLVWKNLLPKLGYWADLSESMCMGNIYCHSQSGLYSLFEPECRQTYNADDRQGYQHVALDCMYHPADFWEEGRALFRNPFPDGMPVRVKVQEMDYPDRELNLDHGKSGNYLQLYAYLDGDESNFAPWNVFMLSPVHLKKGSWKFDKREVIIYTFGLPLAENGVSGYDGIRSTHIHAVAGYPGHGAMDILYGPGNTDILAPIFRDQETFLTLMDFKYASREGAFATSRYPSDYKDSTGAVYNNFRFSVDGSRMGFAHEVGVGDHTFCFESPVPLDAIFFERNPWGLWKPPSLPSVWFNWLKRFLDIPMTEPISRNLFDYACSPVEREEEHGVLAYRDEETGVLYQFKEDMPAETKEVKEHLISYYRYTFDIPIKPNTGLKGNGYYTYVGMYKNARTNRIVLLKV